jgi:DNA processing protein
MTSLVHLTPLDPRYPSRLRGLRGAPASISVEGGSTEADVVVAIVGSREATGPAKRFATELAGCLVHRGAVVVSGGAFGIDAAAHEGALGASGRTWVVAPTGHQGCFPKGHERLFERIARGPGAMIWPFAPTFVHRPCFQGRNRILVALADAVVVVQAGLPSGALNSAKHARKLGKPLWVVPLSPWEAPSSGSLRLLEEGARPLTSAHLFLSSLGLASSGNRPTSPGEPGASRPSLGGGPPLRLSGHEFKALAAISTEPRHADAISAGAGLSPQATTAALLTLALENVVVEGPPGFFRRREAHNR